MADNIINKRKLFCDKYNAVVLCEYTKELNLLKRLINVAEEGFEKQKIIDNWSYDGVCHSFAKTILEYSKAAYDNIILGHFAAVNMINRAILENCVLLDIIVNSEYDDIWKYYIVYSYREYIYKVKGKLREEGENFIQHLYEEYNIDEDFYIKQERYKKPFIDMPYGWTYKINKNFSFSGVCALVNKAEYLGFKMMSEYSHSTSMLAKSRALTYVEPTMGMFISLYIELYRMVTMYCWDTVDDSFDDLAEKLENIFYGFIDYEESVFGRK